MAGEQIPGIEFGLNEAVEIAEGPHVGDAGTIIVLLAVRPEPLYLVELSAGKADVRVRQSALRPGDSRTSFMQEE
jgi:hypothetical protein